MCYIKLKEASRACGNIWLLQVTKVKVLGFLEQKSHRPLLYFINI